MLKHFRKYEKYIFWTIVVVILPTFGVTGIMTTTCGRRDRPPVGQLYGDEISGELYESTQQKLGSFFRVIGQDFKEDAIWEHLTFLRKADDAGVEVSDDEVRDRVITMFRDFEARTVAQRRLRESKELEQFGQNRQILEMIYGQYFQEAQKTARFDPATYQRLLDGANTRAADFESTFREILRIDRLRELVQREAKADPEKVFERYQEQHHRRKADVVVFKAEAFTLTGTAVAKEELKKYYDRHPDRFREQAKVTVEWAYVPASAFDATAPAPSDGEVQALYDRVKDIRYRTIAPQPVTGAAVPTATAQLHKPLAEVKADIVAELREQSKLDLSRKKASELRTRAALALAQGQALTLTALAAEGGAVYGKAGPSEMIDLVNPDDPKLKSIHAFPLLETIDALGTAGMQSLSEAMENSSRSGSFFVHVLEKRPMRVPPLEEIEARVRDSYTNGLDDEVKRYYEDHQQKYKLPGTAAIEYVHVAFSKFEKQVAAEVTGTARAAELLKKAEEKLEAVRKALGERGADGKQKDLQTVALSEGGLDCPPAPVTVERSGKDLPAEARATEVGNRLSMGADKLNELSPAFENEAKTGVFAYLVRQLKPETQQTLEQVKDKVRREVQLEHAFERAHDAADAFAKEAAARPAELRALAAKAGYKVTETPFIARKDGSKEKIEGLVDASALVGALFMSREVGEVHVPAVSDPENRVAAVCRYIAKEPAPAAGFAEHEKELRDQVVLMAKRELYFDWDRKVRLEARGVDEAVLKEAYELRYGADGLAEIEAAHVYVGLDKEVVEQRMSAEAKQKADQALAEIRGGARFDDLARKRSQDPGSKRRGGDLGWFKRGAMVPEFDAAAFNQKPFELTEPVKSKFGWHLVQVTDRKPDGSEVKARHILFKSERGEDDDGQPAALDPETKRLAMAKALEKAKKAEARIAAGEDFAAVARELSEEPGSGERRTFELETPFERRALALKAGELSEIVTTELAQGPEHHLILGEDWSRGQRSAQGERPRLVRHIAMKGGAGKSKLEGYRADLVEKRAAIEKEDEAGTVRSVLADFRKAFEDVAKRRSEAPSAARGGKIGVFHPDPDLERWGNAFRDKLNSLKDGEVSGIVEGKEGYHIVKVLGRKKKPFEEARREIADTLLENVDF